MSIIFRYNFKYGEAIKILFSILAALLFSIITIYIAQDNFSDNYNQFIIGDTTFTSEIKRIDLLFSYLYLSLFFLIFYILNKTTKKDKEANINFEITLSSYLMKKIIKSAELILILISIFIIYNFLNNLMNQTSLLLILVILYTSIMILFFIYTIGKILLIFQFIFPIVLLNLILPSSYYFNNEVISIPQSQETTCLGFFIFLITMIWAFVSFKRNDKLLLSTILTVVFVLYWRNLPHFFNPDEYHMGETYVNFMQMSVFESTFFEDFFPIKGLYDVLPSYLNALINKNEYIYIEQSIIIFRFLFIYLALLSLYFKLDNKSLFILGIFFAYLKVYYLPAVVMIVYITDARGNLLYIFIIILLFYIFMYLLFYPIFGALFLLSILPIFFKSTTTNIMTNSRFHYLLFFPIIIGLIIMIIYKDTLLNISMNLLSTLSSNLYYWGNSSFFYNLEISTIGWIFYAIASFISFIYLWLFGIFSIYLFIKRKRPLIYKNWALFIIPVIYIILMNGYVFGRIDNLFSRGLDLTFFLIVIVYLFIIKLNIFSFKPIFNPTKSLFLMIGILLLIFHSFLELPSKSFMNFVFDNLSFNKQHIVSEDYLYVEIGSIGNLGNGFI